MNFDNILFSVLLIRILFHAFGKKTLYSNTPYSVPYDGNNYNNMVSNKISLIVFMLVQVQCYDEGKYLTWEQREEGQGTGQVQLYCLVS